MAKPSWITLSNSSGTGGGADTVNVTASWNMGSSTRSGTLTIKTTSGLTKTVSLYQSVLPEVTISARGWSNGPDHENMKPMGDIYVEINASRDVASKLTCTYKGTMTNSLGNEVSVGPFDIILNAGSSQGTFMEDGQYVDDGSITTTSIVISPILDSSYRYVASI